MAIEELDDIVEEMADKLGIYGEERCAWVPEFKWRIRIAVEIERRLADAQAVALRAIELAEGEFEV